MSSTFDFYLTEIVACMASHKLKGLIMSESKHTPGKLEWSTGDPQLRNYGIYSIEGGRIAEVLDQNGANAERLVKCWNLCEGRTTEELDDCVVVTKYD